ncbi:MAG: hypothetical protein KatS3mg102_0061 [Planctomycetota bacterium]|nr:MAG: hypothetical protein KatS3mg102_0061 [Planctomycetota bacterium]
MKPLEVVATWLQARREARRHRHRFAEVERFCLFVGYPRSGHSLLGSLLNAHRHVVLAHEVNVLKFARLGFGREQLFGLILHGERLFAERGRRQTEFDYTVPGQWQGRYERLRVIGDKRGGSTARLLAKVPGLLERLRRQLGVPLRLIHHIRNPFDNISTIARRAHKALEQGIEEYFERVERVCRVLERAQPGEVMESFHEDLVADPRRELARLLDWLELEAEPEYLEACAGIVFPSPRKSREQAPWTAELIGRVTERMQRYPFLRRYRFEDG